LLRSSNTSKSKYAIAWMTSGKDQVSFEDSTMEVGAGKSALLLNPTEVETHRFEPNRKTQTHLLELDAQYFEETFLDNDIFNHGTTLTKFKSAASTSEFFYAESNTHSHQSRILTDIRNCPLKGALGEMMLEGSIQQIVALQLSSLASQQKQHTSIPVRDREIILAIKEYLDLSFDQDHSLRALSRMFGINVCKLKKQFKELVGIPVIQYVYDLKMVHAKSLLLENRMNISEVASKIGYRHAHHFTTAFKKKFGISPSRI
jgi:AraC-like DNA-binding protein